MEATNPQDAVMALLASRAAGATICPSEVARVLADAAQGEPASSDWREMMPTVHAAIDRLVVEGRVKLSWKGRGMASRSGPYRIGRGPRG